jgi:cell division septum initiation protein DivIVA
MGMASFVDRLRDLLNDAMHFHGIWEVQTAVSVPEVTHPIPHHIQMGALADDLQKRLDAYGPLLDNIIRQLNELLEYATDPALQLVEEVLRLRIERDSLSGQLNHAGKERDAMRADVRKTRSFAQEADYAKRAAEATAAELSEELEARLAAHERDTRSLKGDLAAKQRTHGEAIEKLKREHNGEIAKLRAAHKIEMSDLEKRAEKRAEKAANRPIPSKDQSRREEFVALLSKSSSPRVPTQTMPIRKGDHNKPKKKR